MTTIAKFNFIQSKGTKSFKNRKKTQKNKKQNKTKTKQKQKQNKKTPEESK